jgi:ubiquinone/menaquinone biosynthesis C-methylase UbiE
MVERIDYDVRQYAVYSAGRALSDAMRQVWAAAFAARAGSERPLCVLDLGSGTGRFTPLLAETFGGPVYGVEPSQRMRRVAEQTAAHPGVRYLAGSAERIPLPDDSCDLVLMFLVLHHFEDRGAAAAEIRRVLRPGGRVIVRSTFRDRLAGLLLWHRFFPGALRVEQRMFPSLAEVIGLFDTVGLRVVALDQVRETMAPNLAAYAQRLRLRAISTFEHLTEDEIERGFAALQAAVDADRTPQPIESDSDLLVLEAPAT